MLESFSIHDRQAAISHRDSTPRTLPICLRSLHIADSADLKKPQ